MSVIGVTKMEVCILNGRHGTLRENSKRISLSHVSLPGKEISYKGELYRERNYCIVRVKATSVHDEEVFMRFNDPSRFNSSVLVGLMSAYDSNFIPTSGPIVLSREELSEEDASKIISNNIQVLSKNPLLRIMDMAENH